MSPLDLYSKCFNLPTYSGYDPVHYRWVLQNIPPGTIIDVCSGRGHILQDLLNRGWKPGDLVSVDLANFHRIPNVHFVQADLETEEGRKLLAAAVPSMDNLLFLGSIEHFTEDTGHALLEIFATVKQQAIITIGIHSDVFFGEELHVTIRSPRWWQKVVERHFKIIKADMEHNHRLVCFVCGRKN